MLAKPAAGHGLSKEKFEAFRAFGYTGSSAFTWQEATDFANHSPVGKSLVCDALGGSHDECVLGGKLTGVLGLIYDVSLPTFLSVRLGRLKRVRAWPLQ